MTFLGRIGGWLRARAENIAALLLASMFFSFLVQIVFRYFLDLPLGWTVEYVAVAWLWGILFGCAFVVRDEDIIRFDLFYHAFPLRWRRVMTIVSAAVIAAVLGWSLPKTVDYVTFMKVERTAFLQLRFDLLFFVYVLFVISAILRALTEIVRAFRGEPGSAEAFDPEHEIHV